MALKMLVGQSKCIVNNKGILIGVVTNVLTHTQTLTHTHTITKPMDKVVINMTPPTTNTNNTYIHCIYLYSLTVL